MTPNDKLQKLFQAALAAPEVESAAPQREYPASMADVAVPASPLVMPVAATPPPTEESPFVAVAQPAAPADPEGAFVKPMANAGLSKEESAELGRILDEKRARMKRRARRSALVTLTVFLLGSGGGYAWFVQSPDRIHAMNEVIRDFRSVGDVSGMVAQYKLALDKVAVRSKHIDQATAAMGVSTGQSKEKDVYMDAEMKEFMSGEGNGKTVGERNRLLEKNFGDAKTNKLLQKTMADVEKQAGGESPAKSGAAANKDEASFDLK